MPFQCTIENLHIAHLKNAGKIVIGENALVEQRGIANNKKFENQAGGELHIYQTTWDNILNYTGATFINQACAKIFINGKIANSSSTFQNEGYIFSGYDASHFSNGTFTNTGIIRDVNGAFSTAQVGTSGIIINKLEDESCGTPVFNDVFELGNGDYTIGTNWYTDKALTSDAGDYDPNTNAFTIDLPVGTHTLYAVFSKSNTCDVKIPITVKFGINAVGVPTIEAEDICPEEDLQLTATSMGATQWAWTGPNNFSSDEQNPIIPSTTANSGDYTLIASNSGGCSATKSINVEVPEAFEFDLSNATQSETGSGMNLYSVELCGGTLPFTVDIDATGGFASSNLLPSANSGCQQLQITYTNGVSWIATVIDANDCSNQSSTIDSDDLGGTPLVVIDGFNTVKETGVGKLDGEVTVNVVGGDDNCSDYTYEWSGPNTDVSQTGGTTSNTLTGLGAGTYTVTVTDCAGSTVVGDINLIRVSGRGGGRKTTLEVSTAPSLQLYPNPAANLVHINYNTEQTEEMTISIADLAGRTLWSQTSNEEEGHLEIPLADFSNGLYIVTIRAENELIGKKKLLIMK